MLAALFRLVQGQVGGLIESLEVLPASRGQVDPHAGGEIDGGVPAQGDLQLPADGGRLLPHHGLGDLAGEKDHKLVPAQTAHNVAGPEQPGQDLGGAVDGLVPRQVAQGVVDLLEIVQVHNKQRAVLPRRHVPKAVLDVLFRGRPVQQAGHGVHVDPLPQLLHLVLQSLYRWQSLP